MGAKKLNTFEYVSALRELVNNGQEVRMIIAGSSMSPFLIHGRDSILFKTPGRELKRGDMVFYQRADGKFVMHRIYRIKKGQFYTLGDAQNKIEGPIEREQIFAIVTAVERKGKWIGPGDFWWEFFEHVWINLVPLRKMLAKLYSMSGRCKK